MSGATEKQMSLIFRLASDLMGRNVEFLSQLPSSIPLSQRQKRNGLTIAEASKIIDQLKADLEAGR